MDIDFRPAEPEEAAKLASIIQETSGGLVDYLLRDIMPFTSPHQILTSQVLSEDSLFSYSNAIVCVEQGEIIGLILAYSWEKQVLSDLMRCYLPQRRLKVVEGLLSSAEPDSLYINTFWVENKFRGQGLADVLMDVAEDWGRREEYSRLSLHVWEGNKRAVSFYQRHGFSLSKRFKFPEHKLLVYNTDKLQLSKNL